MGQLEGKIAVVTGGSTGIGLATAARLAVEGAHVFVTGRREAELDAAVEIIGAGSATAVAGDISDPADLDRLYDAVRARGRGLDVLFANAGGGEFAPLGEISREHYADTFDRNVAGTLFTVQKALPVLNPGASVFLAGSASASSGTPAFGVYSASKAAIRSFGRTWAAELVGRGIRVNTLIPASTVTPGLTGLAPDPAAAEAMLQAMAARIPMGRVAQPEEIANAALFLASDESSFMTGGEIFVDGGSQQI